MNTPRLRFVSALCDCAVTTARQCCRKHSFVLAEAQGVLGGCARAHTNHFRVSTGRAFSFRNPSQTWQLIQFA